MGATRFLPMLSREAAWGSERRVTSRIAESISLKVYLKAHLQSSDVDEVVSPDDVLAGFSKFCISKKWKQPAGVATRLKGVMLDIFGAQYSNHVRLVGSLLELRGHKGVKWTDSVIAPTN